MGCGAGFSGDRVDAPGPVVDAIARSGRPGAIMFETLAERTLALGHVARRADPGAGYEPLLAELVGPVLPACLRGGIPIVGNFGAANPPAAARLLQRLAAEAGLPPPRIAVVHGDDIRDLDLGGMEAAEGDAAPSGTAELVAANVYLGARPIADALRAGAEIVVTGRVADPALALGPLVAHFGWDWDDWDRLAAGTLVGHLLECGSQVTGGYFADPGFKDVPRPEAIGFPIAEVAADGSAVVTKAAGTGGCVSVRTVTEQVLYEVHDPAAYLTPDVILDVTAVRLRQDGADRVAVSGKRLDLRGLLLRRRLDLIGALSVFDDDGGALAAAAPDLPEVRVRLAVSGPDRRPVDQAVQEVLALLCCGPAGGGGMRSQVRNRIRTASCLVPRKRVGAGWSFL